MYNYELLMLTVPEITKDEAATIEFQLDKIINKSKGSIISFERWGKYKLAYPVRRNDYGIYFLVRFSVEGKSFSEDLHSLLAVKFNDLVVRNIVTKLEKNQSMEYQRPPSLEDIPKRHIGSLLEPRGLESKDHEALGGEEEESDLSEKVHNLEDSISKLKLSPLEKQEKRDMGGDDRGDALILDKIDNGKEGIECLPKDSINGVQVKKEV